MQIKRENNSPTEIKLTVTADKSELDSMKTIVLKKLSVDVKVPGFRAGHAPVNLIEKQINPSTLQNEFLNDSVNQLFEQALSHEKLRVVNQPEISVTKFVPYSTMEFIADVEIVGEVRLSDYKSVKVEHKKAVVTAKEVNEILDNLLIRAAEKKEVDRPVKGGDEAVIDFNGTDLKTKEPVAGAQSQDYPLIIGSKSFIPGFEEELIGLKPDESKTFTITFPLDYAAADLQGKKVSFEVKIKKVQELVKPSADDKFAASIGPFKTFAELKDDAKKQLQAEKQREADQQYDNEVLKAISAKSHVDIPKSLVEQEIERMEEEEKRNIIYRGQTWQEHLDSEKVTSEEHHERQRPIAEERIKSGLLLGEIAEKEKISITPEELQVRVTLLKSQYQDVSMQTELDKPENRRDLTSRLMIEKTLDRLRSYASKGTSK